MKENDCIINDNDGFEFGERLNQILKEKKISQKMFARQIGVSESIISKYIAGERMPLLKTVILMANVLNVSVQYLIEGNNDCSQIPGFRLLNKKSNKIINLFSDEVFKNFQVFLSDSGELYLFEKQPFRLVKELSLDEYVPISK